MHLRLTVSKRPVPYTAVLKRVKRQYASGDSMRNRLGEAPTQICRTIAEAVTLT